VFTPIVSNPCSRSVTTARSQAPEPGALSFAAAAEATKKDAVRRAYDENHSFDNLYGRWEGVNGLSQADPPHTTQV
jgi:phospholipase C